MSTPIIEVTQPNATYNTDDSVFEVQSGASLGLSGTNNTVFLDCGAGLVTVTSMDRNVTNTITGMNGGANIGLFGHGTTVNVGDNSFVGMNGDYTGLGNIVSVGAGSRVEESGSYNQITLGANSTLQACGTNVTINAIQGGSTITENTLRVVNYFASATINANTDTITLQQGISNINGTGNQISFYNDGMADYGGQVQLNLDGGNNTISYSANSVSGKQVLIQDSDGDYVQEDASGAISFSSCHFSLVNGLATLTFADGNSVKISGVLSSTQDTTLTGSSQVGQVNHLVSAMASYSPGSGGASSTLTAQAPVETALFASAHH